MRVSNSNLMIPITLRIKELLIIRKTVTVKVSVEKDNSGKYGLSDTEMNKLEAAMFPTE